MNRLNRTGRFFKKTIEGALAFKESPMPSTKIIALSFAGFIVVAATPAASQAEVRFRYNQQDLSSLDRTQMLYQRIANQAANACELTSHGYIPRRDIEAVCAAQTTQDIVAGIDNARLSRVHAQAQNGANFARK